MARLSKSIDDDAGLLTAALEGLQLQKQRIEEQIRDVKARLRRPGSSAAGSSKRVLSPAARKRIAAAQRKRWADFRKKSNPAQP